MDMSSDICDICIVCDRAIEEGENLCTSCIKDEEIEERVLNFWYRYNTGL